MGKALFNVVLVIILAVIVAFVCIYFYNTNAKVKGLVDRIVPRGAELVKNPKDSIRNFGTFLDDYKTNPSGAKEHLKDLTDEQKAQLREWLDEIEQEQQQGSGETTPEE